MSVFDVLHADETHWLLLQKGGSKKWYVWALSMEDAVYCHLNASRSKDVARRLLDGYRGVALTDGYAAYQSLQGPGLTLRLLTSQDALTKSLLHEALSYTLNLWPGLKLLLDEPCAPLDNNLCERDLRGVVSGRSLCVTPNPGPPGDSLRGEEAPVDARSPVG